MPEKKHGRRMSVHDPGQNEFISRRSIVYGSNGVVATSQPLAAQVGLKMLQDGGNAVDAGVATMAALGVLEPMDSGFGGDAFALVALPHDGEVVGLNGSGGAGSRRTAEELRSLGLKTMPTGNPGEGHVGMTVTIPGALKAWDALLQRYGTVQLHHALEPAERLAAEGFPVAEVSSWLWQRYVSRLRAYPGGHELMLGSRAPRTGETVSLPTLAATIQEIRRFGPERLYSGPLAERIVATVQELGGALSLRDLAGYAPEWVKPISERYGEYRMYQCPPNGQGVVALLALRGLDNGQPALYTESADRAHAVVTELMSAFDLATRHVGDPRTGGISYEELLRVAPLDPRVTVRPSDRGSDTGYVAVVDSTGMACSLIVSLFEGFGTGAVVPGTGIALQNRGALFSLEEGHPNELQPGKRPYHTIMPSILTRDDGWLAAFGVVGGFRQPQAQVQIMMNISDHHMGLQKAIDWPRLGIEMETGEVVLEPGFSESVIKFLRSAGLQVRHVDGYDRGFTGSAQIACRLPTGVIAGASDPRKDGCAVAY